MSPLTKRKQVLASLTLVAVSLIVAILMGELVVRALKLAPVGDPSKMRIFAKLDPLLGWHKTPNSTKKRKTNEYTVIETFNSRGIRGPEYSYEKSDGEYRILVIGDSFAEGYTVEFEEMFSEVLKRNLNGGGRVTEVINAGTGGYSTDQEYLLFTSELYKYNPDLTVLTFCNNDVWFNGQPMYGITHKPFFEIQGDSVVLTNYPLQPPQQREDDRDAASATVAWKIKKWLGTHSALYSLIQQRIKNTYALRSLGIKLRIIEPSEDFEKENDTAQLPTPLDIKPWQATYDAGTEFAWLMTEALLKALHREVEGIGSGFVVVYVPPKSTIYPDYWEATQKKYGMKPEEWDPNRTGMMVREICSRNGIDCIDPTETFRKEAEVFNDKGKKLYFGYDPHWTREGHRLVGEILTEYIEGNYLK